VSWHSRDDANIACFLAVNVARARQPPTTTDAPSLVPLASRAANSSSLSLFQYHQTPWRMSRRPLRQPSRRTSPRKLHTPSTLVTFFGGNIALAWIPSALHAMPTGKDTARSAIDVQISTSLRTHIASAFRTRALCDSEY
jgi:hypothetical protein